MSKSPTSNRKVLTHFAKSLAPNGIVELPENAFEVHLPNSPILLLGCLRPDNHYTGRHKKLGKFGTISAYPHNTALGKAMQNVEYERFCKHSSLSFGSCERRWCDLLLRTCSQLVSCFQCDRAAVFPHFPCTLSKFSNVSWTVLKHESGHCV